MVVAQLFLQMVVAVAFLQQGVTSILFVAEDGVDPGHAPLPAKGAVYPSRIQIAATGAEGIADKGASENLLYHQSFAASLWHSP